MKVEQSIILEGLPSEVDRQMQSLLRDGWHLNGELWHRDVDGNNIAVQGMYLPSGENLGGVYNGKLKQYLYNVTTNYFVDLELIDGYVNTIHAKPVRGKFSYTITVAAYSELTANTSVAKSLSEQRNSSDDTFDIQLSGQ